MGRVAIGCAWVAVALVAAGCVKTLSMSVADVPLPPRPEGHTIDVYIPLDAPVALHHAVPGRRLASEVPAGAATVGRVDSTCGVFGSWAMAVEDARREARKLGGDALLISRWGLVRCVDAEGEVSYDQSFAASVLRYDR